MLCLIIGGTGMGKTTFAREMISQLGPTLVYDPEGEFMQMQNCMCFGNPDSDIEHGEDIDFQRFCDIVWANNDKAVVFDECTSYYEEINSNLSNKMLRQIISRRRHKRYFLVFIFHTLREVSERVMNAADTVVLFRTGDRPEYVRNKFRGMNDLQDAHRRLFELGSGDEAVAKYEMISNR